MFWVIFLYVSENILIRLKLKFDIMCIDIIKKWFFVFKFDFGSFYIEVKIIFVWYILKWMKIYLLMF